MALAHFASQDKAGAGIDAGSEAMIVRQRRRKRRCSGPVVDQDPACQFFTVRVGVGPLVSSPLA